MNRPFWLFFLHYILLNESYRALLVKDFYCSSNPVNIIGKKFLHEKASSRKALHTIKKTLYLHHLMITLYQIYKLSFLCLYIIFIYWIIYYKRESWGESCGCPCVWLPCAQVFFSCWILSVDISIRRKIHWIMEVNQLHFFQYKRFKIHAISIWNSTCLLTNINRWYAFYHSNVAYVAQWLNHLATMRVTIKSQQVSKYRLFIFLVLLSPLSFNKYQIMLGVTASMMNSRPSTVEWLVGWMSLTPMSNKGQRAHLRQFVLFMTNNHE